MLKHISFLVAGVIALAFSAVNPHNVEAEIFRNISDLNDSVGFAQDPIFNGVGLLVGTDFNGDNFVTGTAFLLEDGDGVDGTRWLGTAGHTLFSAPDTPWERLRFFNRPDVLGGDLNDFFEIDLTVPYPGFNGSEPNGGRGNDIGLARLTESVVGVNAIDRFFGPESDLIGADFITAGYGQPGTFGNIGAFDGIRRGGRNTIDSFGANFGVTTIEEQFLVSDFDRFNSDSPLPLEWQASNIDSGSPWLIDINGDLLLAGITNGGLFGDLNSFAINTTRYNDFIDNTIQANSVPEPGTMGLLGLGMVGAAVKRRRN